jgi:non-heme chloroperoxidase
VNRANSMPQSLWRLAMALCVSVAPPLVAQNPRVTFVTVERDVALEVLDWGGSGMPVVLLAGGGQTAHSFDRFAQTLASHYRVYGITRRGFGASSKPATGYLADRLGDDVLAVIDSLRLSKPVLAGHSLAGQELSSIGSRRPEKVAGLIYLDAGYAYAFYDTAKGDFRADVAVAKQRLERLQIAANRGDVASLDTIFSGLLNQDLPALRRDLMEMQQASKLGQFPVGQPLLPPVSKGVQKAIEDGFQRYTSVRGPVLAIYRLENPPMGVGTDEQVTLQWLQRVRSPAGTFARGVPQAQIVMIPHASHFVFESNPAEVLSAMRAFTNRLPRP